MLTNLIRQVLTRLTTPLKSASYSCGKCGLKVTVTDHPDRVGRVLDLALDHKCRPPAKIL
ncbi:hypothetical protein [Streptomyces sp. NPDC088775]|uniref:hypothetical protein n=1 Tax=Streptomyces sp. NPDC088775 TaxID=3365896 RepID=UPI0037F4B21B